MHALALLREQRFPTLATVDLLEQAFRLATAFDRTVYDCLYVAAALEQNGYFITADDRLPRALAGDLPVKRLGGL